jgi:arginine/lysine/ornithine decarboxylase
MEMVSRDYVLAMTSIMDTQDGFERLYMALQQIDETLEKCDNQQESQKEYLYRIHHMDTYQKQIYKISEAESKSREMVNLNQAAGRISAEYIYLYPPGIPFVTPGEQITEDNIKDLKDCISMGLEIYGLSENEYIHVIREQ